MSSDHGAYLCWEKGDSEGGKEGLGGRAGGAGYRRGGEGGREGRGGREETMQLGRHSVGVRIHKEGQEEAS